MSVSARPVAYGMDGDARPPPETEDDEERLRDIRQAAAPAAEEAAPAAEEAAQQKGGSDPQPPALFSDDDVDEEEAGSSPVAAEEPTPEEPEADELEAGWGFQATLARTVMDELFAEMMKLDDRLRWEFFVGRPAPWKREVATCFREFEFVRKFLADDSSKTKQREQFLNAFLVSRSNGGAGPVPKPLPKPSPEPEPRKRAAEEEPAEEPEPKRPEIEVEPHVQNWFKGHRRSRPRAFEEADAPEVAAAKKVLRDSYHASDPDFASAAAFKTYRLRVFKTKQFKDGAGNKTDAVQGTAANDYAATFNINAKTVSDSLPAKLGVRIGTGTKRKRQTAAAEEPAAAELDAAAPAAEADDAVLSASVVFARLLAGFSKSVKASRAKLADGADTYERVEELLRAGGYSASKLAALAAYARTLDVITTGGRHVSDASDDAFGALVAPLERRDCTPAQADKAAGQLFLGVFSRDKFYSLKKTAAAPEPAPEPEEEEEEDEAEGYDISPVLDGELRAQDASLKKNKYLDADAMRLFLQKSSDEAAAAATKEQAARAEAESAEAQVSASETLSAAAKKALTKRARAARDLAEQAERALQTAEDDAAFAKDALALLGAGSEVRVQLPYASYFDEAPHYKIGPYARWDHVAEDKNHFFESGYRARITGIDPKTRLVRVELTDSSVAGVAGYDRVFEGLDNSRTAFSFDLTKTAAAKVQDAWDAYQAVQAQVDANPTREHAARAEEDEDEEEEEDVTEAAWEAYQTWARLAINSPPVTGQLSLDASSLFALQTSGAAAADATEDGVRVDSLLAEYNAFAELLTGDDGVAEKWTQLIMDAFNNIDNGAANDADASMFTVQVGNLASSDPAKFKLPLISLLLNADLVPAHYWDLWFPYYAQPAPLVGKYGAIAEAFGVTVAARESVPASAVARLTDKDARPARGAEDRAKDANEFRSFKTWRESQKAIAWTTEIAPPDALNKKAAFYELVTEQLRLNPQNRKQFQVAVSQARVLSVQNVNQLLGRSNEAENEQTEEEDLRDDDDREKERPAAAQKKKSRAKPSKTAADALAESTYADLVEVAKKGEAAVAAKVAALRMARVYDLLALPAVGLGNDHAHEAGADAKARDLAARELLKTVVCMDALSKPDHAADACPVMLQDAVHCGALLKAFGEWVDDWTRRSDKKVEVMANVSKKMEPVQKMKRYAFCVTAAADAILRFEDFAMHILAVRCTYASLEPELRSEPVDMKKEVAVPSIGDSPALVLTVSSAIDALRKNCLELMDPNDPDSLRSLLDDRTCVLAALEHQAARDTFQTKVTDEDVALLRAVDEGRDVPDRLLLGQAAKGSTQYKKTAEQATFFDKYNAQQRLKIAEQLHLEYDKRPATWLAITAAGVEAAAGLLNQ